ncbi:hypothetical protein BsWGS_10780 [Bradybaena similaris]
MSSYMDKLNGFVNSTYVGFSLTLSKDVGILQALMEAQRPLTSQEIAEQRGLKERYVRELLGSLATAEVIQASTNEAGSLVYHLEEDEKKVFKTHLLTRISFPMAMIRVYEDVKSCISNTGPHGFRMPAKFHDVIEEYGPIHFEVYVNTIMKSVDGLKPQLESGIDVMEVGCGRGRMLAKIAQMFPKSSFTASDNLDSLLDHQKANLGHLPNVECGIIDLCSPSNLPSKQYDWVYCVNVIHDVPEPQEALRSIRKMTKPGGVFTMIDFASSGSPIAERGNLLMACMYTVSTFMSLPESYQREDSHAMGPCWGKQTALNLLSAAGFEVNTVALEYPITLFVCK